MARMDGAWYPTRGLGILRVSHAAFGSSQPPEASARRAPRRRDARRGGLGSEAAVCPMTHSGDCVRSRVARALLRNAILVRAVVEPPSHDEPVRST